MPLVIQCPMFADLLQKSEIHPVLPVIPAFIRESSVRR
jgi:hypothetical protein